MAQMLLPDSRFRSGTAVSDKADMRDENIYSALLVAHGGSGVQKVFTVPQGQQIPALGSGTNVTTRIAHQANYTELTTNLSKAGELGSSIGDAALRAIGITVEAAAFTAASGATRNFGATPFELSDLLSKTFFQLKIAGKLQISGPLHAYPASGGMFGSISTTGTGATVGIASNGYPGSKRRLKVPILVQRTDTLEGVFGVAGGASLAFSDTSGGQPTLMWFVLDAAVKGDVR